MFSLNGNQTSELLVDSEFVEMNAALSPDGRWLAYQSDESGRFEVYVRPFPDVESGRTVVSTNGVDSRVGPRRARTLLCQSAGHDGRPHRH